MLEQAVQIVLYVVGIYAVLGTMVAAAMHARGLHTLDHGTHGASIVFRALITPGLIALWPVMLLKWRRAALGGNAAGSPDGPVRAEQLRRLHGVAARVLAVLAPVVLGVAVYARQPASLAHPVASLTDAEALPHLLAEIPHAFGELPVTLRLREDGSGKSQIELDIAHDLRRPALGLFWIDGAETKIAPGPGMYLGNVWGPGARRFTIDREKLARGGTLLLYSFIDAEVVARAEAEVVTP